MKGLKRHKKHNKIVKPINFMNGLRNNLKDRRREMNSGVVFIQQKLK